MNEQATTARPFPMFDTRVHTEELPNVTPTPEQAAEFEKLEFRRTFAKVVNCTEPTKAGEYPMVGRLPGNVALVIQATARKFTLIAMYPEIEGEDGCKMVELLKPRWKKDAIPEYHSKRAIEVFASL